MEQKRVERHEHPDFQYTSEYQGMQLALEDGIAPNFNLIKKYYSKLNDSRFYNFYKYYKDKIDLNTAINLIVKHNLTINKSDLIYFLTEYAASLENTEWFTEVNIEKVHHDEHKQKIELQKFLSKIVSQKRHENLSHNETIKTPAIKEIVFNTDKQPTIKINSYPLCYDIINLLLEHYSEEIPALKQRNLNRRQYKKNFILGLKPFVAYLSKETAAFNSKNEIYAFISEFINVLNNNINLDAIMIKDGLRAKKAQ